MNGYRRRIWTSDLWVMSSRRTFIITYYCFTLIVFIANYQWVMRSWFYYWVLPKLSIVTAYGHLYGHLYGHQTLSLFGLSWGSVGLKWTLNSPSPSYPICTDQTDSFLPRMSLSTSELGSSEYEYPSSVVLLQYLLPSSPSYSRPCGFFCHISPMVLLMAVPDDEDSCLGFIAFWFCCPPRTQRT